MFAEQPFQRELVQNVRYNRRMVHSGLTDSSQGIEEEEAQDQEASSTEIHRPPAIHRARRRAARRAIVEDSQGRATENGGISEGFGRGACICMTRILTDSLRSPNWPPTPLEAGWIAIVGSPISTTRNARSIGWRTKIGALLRLCILGSLAPYFSAFQIDIQQTASSSCAARPQLQRRRPPIAPTNRPR